MPSPVYICVDVETAGPHPAEYALLSIGAVVVDDPAQSFYIELQPDRNIITDESLSIHKLALDVLAKRGTPPKQAMEKFAAWVQQQAAGRSPIFVAFNAAFDWMFVNDYLHRYTGDNPFGHRALDMKALFMGLTSTPWEETSYQNVSHYYDQPEALAHDALQDAQQGAALFAAMLADLAQSRAKEKVQ
jgi:DNA polymerase III epsilon subunit-like protein